MIHGKYSTWEIWYIEDMIHERYGSMWDMVHERYGTCEIWYPRDMVYGIYGT